MKKNHTQKNFLSRYKALLILIIIVVAGAFIALSLQDSNQLDPGNTKGQSGIPKALQHNLKDYSGNNRELSSYLQKGPVVVNSWAVWCPFCTKELDDFATAQEQFKDKVTIIAINRAEPLWVSKGFTDELGISQKLVFLQDPDDKFYQSLGGFSMPETIFVSSNGTIVEHKRGPLTLEEITQKITSLVGG
ncbi:redoxin domain-containing protein [Candidatus Saccharibacteria bacterium]|nr:redoxin domain-containing protein [Candidatus Saccharibacteria bacterium]